MKTRTLKVICENGLHLRVAAKVVEHVKKHDAQVHILCKDCPRANACSIMELLMLGAQSGTEIQIVADGKDEDKVIDALSEVFSDGSGI